MSKKNRKGVRIVGNVPNVAKKKRLGSRNLIDLKGRKVQRRLGKLYIEAEPQGSKKSWRYGKQCKKRRINKSLEDIEKCLRTEIAKACKIALES